jgi:two-component system, NarL family, nitrate/nitrite response regulator NarL
MTTLLLVGGERNYSEDVAMLLELDGYAIVGAPGTGEEGAEYAAHYQPEIVLVISTQNLDEADGLPSLRALREAAPQSRLIVYTARNHPRYVQQALNLGVDAYVIKTVPFGTLKDILHAGRETMGFVG